MFATGRRHRITLEVIVVDRVLCIIVQKLTLLYMGLMSLFFPLNQIPDLIYLMLKVNHKLKQQYSLNLNIDSNIINITVEQTCKCQWLKLNGVDGDAVDKMMFLCCFEWQHHWILAHFVQLKNGKLFSGFFTSNI